MPMIWGGNRSAWDFGNPKNWAINKPLEQNLIEAGTGLQIMGTVIPEALAYKAAQAITANLATKTAQAAVTTQTAAVATTTGGAGAALTAGSAGAIIGLAGTGLKVGAGLYGLEWLKKNWWIPALFIGGFIALKYLDKQPNQRRKR